MKKFASLVLSPWSKRSAAIGSTLLVLALLVACGDDDSSDFATRPSGDSSSACEDCDGSSSSEAKSSSSSSVTPKSSSSETSVSSSSSAKSSSSSVKSSSSVAYVEPCRTDSVDTCEYGTLTDERDGQTYKTVTIGTQIWMAENLNYETTNSFCYNGAASNCTKYGRLYTWAAAMDSVGTWSTNSKGCGYYGTTCSPTYPVRGICPEGWHLPTKAEFETLFAAVGGKSTAGKMLKSTSGWNSSGNGTDAYAFSALPSGLRDGGTLPSGLRDGNGGDFNGGGNRAYFWSSTEDVSYYAYFMYLFYGHDGAYLDNYYKDDGFSVRCLKD